jgi:NADPH:quinone reductase-like Zn-dependent oxidoreductase
MLFTRGRLMAGQDVLITGIGGGVATAALQLTLMAGARAWVSSRHDAKLERARELGATGMVNTNHMPLHRWIREQTQGRGVDLIIDSIGGDSHGDLLAALARGGKLVSCGATSGIRPATHLQRIFWNQLEVIGSTMGSDADVHAMLAAVSCRQLRPVLDVNLPLAEAQAAFERIATTQQFGKVTLTVRSTA